LEGASGERFDRAYMDQMVKDHEKTLKLVQETAKNAKDPELKQAAEKAAPEVEKHLEMAKQISDKKGK
jgi:putative membrane protein